MTPCNLFIYDSSTLIRNAAYFASVSAGYLHFWYCCLFSSLDRPGILVVGQVKNIYLVQCLYNYWMYLLLLLNVLGGCIDSFKDIEYWKLYRYLLSWSDAVRVISGWIAFEFSDISFIYFEIILIFHLISNFSAMVHDNLRYIWKCLILP